MSLAANQINASYCSNPADLAKFIKDQFGQTIKNRYEIKLVLGQGSFGQVFLVNDKHANNEEYIQIYIIDYKLFSSIFIFL